MHTLLQQVIEIGQKGKSVHLMLPEICNCISVFPDVIGVIISYNEINYYSTHFTISKNIQLQNLTIADKIVGSLSIYYKEQVEYKQLEDDEIICIASLISGFISENRLLDVAENFNKRMQELAAIRKTKEIINSGLPTERVLQDVCDTLPQFWQFADCACCRITFDNAKYTSHGFAESSCSMKESFVTFDNTTGTIEIFYTKDDYIDTENLFLPEERELANTIGLLLCRYLNDTKGRLLSNNPILNNNPTSKEELSRESLINSDKPIQKMLNEQTLDKYIY
ncbi:MAG: hypothetical protein IK117_08090, partial [Bacteroidales bacterium]|nr:hypothetical protein [Bacteroidales bacterium]